MTHGDGHGDGAREELQAMIAVHALDGRIEAVQVVWTDSAGRLPRHPGYDNPPDRQRLRGPVPAQAPALPAGVRATRTGGHGSAWVRWPHGSA
ncbi:hypothetical protein NUM3379_26010 [Kineococcus sp. NUM-3379]